MLTKRLVSVPIFRGLTEEEIGCFADCARLERHSAGEVLMTCGTPAKKFYYVISGEMTLRVLDQENMPIMVSVLGTGGTAGWSALIPPHMATATLTAVTDLHVVEFDGELLLEAVQRHPKLGLRVMTNASAIVIQRLSDARKRLGAALEQTRS